MRIDRHADPAAFWRATQAFLERDEAGNTQVLAIGSRYAVEPGATPPTGFSVADAGDLLAAAILTAKETLFLTPAGRDPLRALHDELLDMGHVVTDVIAERATAEIFAQLGAAPFRTLVGLRLYRLDAVSPVPAVPGAMHQALDTDFDLLCAWQQAFFTDANVREAADEIPELVRRRLRTGGAWLWKVDGVPVAHAGYRQTPIRSARIAPVYTSPEHRGRGYATALVAELSRHLLAQRRFPLYLFADRENSTSNGIYRRAGFRMAGEHVHLTRVVTEA
ncbi:MAG: GNAT family N-acetyltransferase [Acidobacteriota bacterium]